MTGPVACATCRTLAPPLPWEWSREVAGSGDRWTCPACTRAQLRSTEARLDAAWS